MSSLGRKVGYASKWFPCAQFQGFTSLSSRFSGHLPRTLIDLNGSMSALTCGQHLMSKFDRQNGGPRSLSEDL
jgi:hypothetical protein